MDLLTQFLALHRKPCSQFSKPSPFVQNVIVALPFQERHLPESLEIDDFLFAAQKSRMSRTVYRLTGIFICVSLSRSIEEVHVVEENSNKI